MFDYMADDQEPDVSIANLSVQIFTVPSVAQHLIECHDGLTKLVQFFSQIFEDEAKYSEDGQLDLTDWLDEREYDYTRCNHVLTDIQYILGAIPSEWSGQMRKNFIAGAKTIIDLISKLQLADPQARQTDIHVIKESRNWYCVFNITSHLMQIANLVKAWCKEDAAVLKPITNYLLEALAAKHGTQVERKSISFSSGEVVEVVDFDVLRRPCSVHIPLNQFLAMLLTCFNQRGLADCDIAALIQSKADLLDILNPVLTVLTMLAQIKGGMWKRNGIFGDGQYYIYNDPKFAPLNKVNDLMLVQAVVSVIDDPSVVMISLLDRFNLIEWALLQDLCKDSSLPEETFELADELLLIVIAVLSERISPDVSQVSSRDAMKHRLIHLLVSDEMTHSEVLKNIHTEVSRKESEAEDILREIADLVTSKKDTSKRVYQLKAAQQEHINPFYYFYTRNQRDEVDAATVAKDIFNKAPVEKWPALNPLFKGLPRLAWSKPMMALIKGVLQRWLQSPEKQTMLVKHLHKTLYLINIGLNVDASWTTTADFIRALESNQIHLLLGKIEPPNELKDMLQKTLGRVHEARKTLLGKSAAQDESNDPVSSDNERKRRAQAAAERKAKVMAQMNQMQKRFAQSHKSELDEMQVSSRPEDEKATQYYSKRSEVKAVGVDKSLAKIEAVKFTCILCQEDCCTADGSSEDTLVFATYVVNSCVLSRLSPIDPHLTGRFVFGGVLPCSLKCGPTVTSCGHVMHEKCYRTMFENLSKQHQDE